MITQDVSLDGFTASDWMRLADVFRTPTSGVGDEVAHEQAGRGGVVAVTTGNRLRKLLHTKRGRLDLRVDWPMKLPELAGRYDASWAVELAAGALEELVERFSERLRPRQEYLEQALELARALRELEAEGLVAMWPKRFADIPVPGSRVIHTALDMFCGDGRAIALGVFRHGELHTGLVARRRGMGFDRIVGPDELRSEMGLLSGDFRRDYRHFAAAAERNVAPLSLGVFGELLTFQALAGILRRVRSRSRSQHAICRSLRLALVWRCRSGWTWGARRSPVCAVWRSASARAGRFRRSWGGPKHSCRATCPLCWASTPGPRWSVCSNAIAHRRSATRWLRPVAFGAAWRSRSC